MKKLLLAVACSFVLMSAKSQSHTAISRNDLQYIKTFFAANFIKTAISQADLSNVALFDYEITNDAIIIYKTELSQKTGVNTHHWYYLQLNDIRIQNYNSNLNYFKGAHAIWFEGKKGKLPHGLSKKFTKVDDATYMSGWLNVPFKYNSFRDLDQLKNILDRPAEKMTAVTTKPAETKEAYRFESSLLTDLHRIAAQLNLTNAGTVMKAEGYKAKPQAADNREVNQYEHNDKRMVILAADHSDTETVYILKALMLGIETDGILADFKKNGIAYAGTNKDENSENFYFAAPGSGYSYQIELGKNGWSRYVYLFKTIGKKKTKAIELAPDFAFIDIASIYKLDSAMHSFTLEGKHYFVKKKKEAAAFFNAHLYKAVNQGNNHMAPFAILGKTDFTKKSIAFTVKDDQLFITLNLPLNGTCDYGLKEIPARYAGITQLSGTGATKGYAVNFAYDYRCESKHYKYLTVYIADKEGASLTAMTLFLQALPG